VARPASHYRPLTDRITHDYLVRRLDSEWYHENGLQRRAAYCAGEPRVNPSLSYHSALHYPPNLRKDRLISSDR